MSEIGRQVKYGIAVGADTAPTNWLNQLSFGLNPVRKYANNDSAYGVISRTNRSTITGRYTAGDLEAKLTAETAGIILLGSFGSVSSAATADASGDVYAHTFNINQDVDGQALTLVRQDTLATEKFKSARIGEWSLSMALDDYVKYTASIMAKDGTTTTATAAFLEEAEFVAKHFTLKSASNVAGLAGATAESDVESFDITVNPNLEADFGAGSDEPYGFSSRGYEASFELTCRYNDNDFRDAFRNGTELAFGVTLTNTDETIGTSANPSLSLTQPRVNITDWTRNEDLDGPITQTMTGTIHYSPADAYMIRALLTNTTPSYV